jgi:hypothetical protein
VHKFLYVLNLRILMFVQFLFLYIYLMAHGMKKESPFLDNVFILYFFFCITKCLDHFYDYEFRARLFTPLDSFMHSSQTPCRNKAKLQWNVGVQPYPLQIYCIRRIYNANFALIYLAYFKKTIDISTILSTY